jgi:predicted SprT family Zn-dependent metalloprotease
MTGAEFIKALALSYMEEHGLIEEGWKFKWDTAKKRGGVCYHSRKTIGLSKFVAKYRTYEETEDTILHEIAHALVGPGHGHGPVWKAKAREIGAKPERCFESEDLPDGKYEAVCENCGPLGILRWRRSKNRLHLRCRGNIGWREVALATT